MRGVRKKNEVFSPLRLIRGGPFLIFMLLRHPVIGIWGMTCIRHNLRTHFFAHFAPGNPYRSKSKKLKN